MAYTPRVGDIGTALIERIRDQSGAVVNVATATVKTIFLTKPNGVILEFAAGLDTAGGTDGRIRYVTRGVLFDWNASGQWHIQGFVVVDGNEWSTVPSPFSVGPSAHYPGL